MCSYPLVWSDIAVYFIPLGQLLLEPTLTCGPWVSVGYLSFFLLGHCVYLSSWSILRFYPSYGSRGHRMVVDLNEHSSSRHLPPWDYQRFFKPEKASVLRHWKASYFHWYWSLPAMSGVYRGGNRDRFKIIKFHVGQTRYLCSQFQDPFLFLIQVLIFKWETWWDWIKLLL